MEWIDEVRGSQVGASLVVKDRQNKQFGGSFSILKEH